MCITASIAGILGSYGTPMYCATKHAMVGFVRSMAAADELEGVKVAGVCPGYDQSICPTAATNKSRFVNTPLWTDAPNRLEQYSTENAKMLTPEEVADGMLSVIQDGKYGGGSLLELSPNERRTIPEWNISPPSAMYHTESPDMVARNLAPIKRTLDKERKGAAPKL